MSKKEQLTRVGGMFDVEYVVYLVEGDKIIQDVHGGLTRNIHASNNNNKQPSL
jgi:hypothetical protein